MKQLVIADDHPIVLDGLATLLESAGFGIAARCVDGDAAWEAIRTLKPDVAVLDIQMPKRTGLELLRAIRAAPGRTRVVLLTATLDNARVVEAIDMEADGLVLKETAAERIVQCVEAVAAGQQWIDNDALKRVIGDLTRRDTASEVRKLLTPREGDVARLAARGLRNKPIADELGLTEGTVKMHLHSIYDKLGIASRAELAAKAGEFGVG